MRAQMHHVLNRKAEKIPSVQCPGSAFREEQEAQLQKVRADCAYRWYCWGTRFSTYRANPQMPLA